MALETPNFIRQWLQNHWWIFKFETLFDHFL